MPKKTKPKSHRKSNRVRNARDERAKVTPEQAIDFLESFRDLQAGRDLAKKAISIRVPENLLKSFKARANFEKRPYQTIMIEALREFLLQERQYVKRT